MRTGTKVARSEGTWRGRNIGAVTGVSYQLSRMFIMNSEPMAPAKRPKDKANVRRARVGSCRKHSMLVGREPSDVKARQARKIRQLADTLVDAGFVSLDEQATALGLSRSTTWTLLKAHHKNYGLSAVLIKRVLAKPDLDAQVRSLILEYVRERAAGLYGHNDTQLRRFIQLLGNVASADVHALEFADIDGGRNLRRAAGRR